MNARMVATRRSYTQAEKVAYQHRVLRRRVALTASNMSALAARVEPHLTQMPQAFEEAAPAVTAAGDALRGLSLGLCQVDEMIHSINPDGSHQVGDLRVWSPDPRLGQRQPIEGLRELLEQQANEIPVEQQFPEGWPQR